MPKMKKKMKKHGDKKASMPMHDKPMQRSMASMMKDRMMKKGAY